MPFTKPTTLPEFAMLLTGDGPLEADNIQTPPAQLKNYGWDYGRKPEREFFNWLANHQYRWTAWHDQEIDTLKANAVIISDKDQTKYTSDADSYFRSQR